MNRTFAVFFAAAFLLATGIQGIVTSRKGRCMCSSKDPNPVPLRYLANLEIHPRSSSCNHVEIIVTWKRPGMQSCLDPESKAVQAMVENYKRRSSRMLQEKRQRMASKKSLQ